MRADQCCTDTDCNTAAEGRATCVGDQCTCVGVGVRTCPNGACIAQTACCSNELTCAGFCGTQCCLDGDCPEGRTCLWGSCVCPEGTKLCNGRCIPSTQCCIDGDCGTGAICAGGVCGCASSSEHYCGRSAGCRPSNVCCTNDDCTPGYCGGTTYLQTNGCYCTGGYIYCVNTHTCEPSQATCPSGS